MLVEPPGGHHTRAYEPFVDDVPDAERSLWWWHYQTSKRGVVLDLDGPDGVRTFRELVATADVVLEGEPPDRLARLGLDHTDLRAEHPELVWVSVTPFGRTSPRRDEPATDLTVLAGGGPVWMCGYDDHSLPPVRGGGNQGYQTACLWAVSSALVAIVQRDVSGVGQHVDVSMHAAANVTTEGGSYEWLVGRTTLQRQTGRHATATPSTPTQQAAADGRDVHIGFPPTSPKQIATLRDWIHELGLADEVPELFWLDVGITRGGLHLSELGQDPEATAVFGTERAAMELIASRLSAYNFFLGTQQRGLTCGIIYSPEEVMADPHFVERGFPVEVFHEDLDRFVTYPGAPYRMSRTPWRIARRAPHLGEHDDEILWTPPEA